MGLLDGIFNDLNRPNAEMQSLSKRSVSPGLSALAATLTPIGFASDAALAYQNNKFADFLNEDQQRRSAILQQLSGLDPKRRLQLMAQLQASQPTLEGTLAQPNAGRVFFNSLGLLGSILGPAKAAGSVGRAVGLLDEPFTKLAPIGGGRHQRQFAEQTGRWMRKGSAEDIPFSELYPRKAVPRRQVDYLRDPKTQQYRGSRKR